VNPGKFPTVTFGDVPQQRPGQDRNILWRGHHACFVVQLHDATTLHFDFRLQSGQCCVRGPVPKGPSLDPGIRRLAVPVEDHSLSAGDFEGVHEEHRRGTGGNRLG